MPQTGSLFNTEDGGSAARGALGIRNPDTRTPDQSLLRKFTTDRITDTTNNSSISLRMKTIKTGQAKAPASHYFFVVFDLPFGALGFENVVFT